MIEKIGWVYILTNRLSGILYTGVTSDLIRRIAEHQAGQIAGFTQRLCCINLVRTPNALPVVIDQADR
jgi:putative endonuclease